MKKPIGLKQFRKDGCLSYLVYDRAAAQAALIDPELDLLDEYREYLAQAHLNLSLIIETRVHPDHVSAAHLLKRETGARVAMSAKAECPRTDLPLTPGEALMVGALAFTTLEVPGSCETSIAIYGEGLLFSGDTLWAGGSGEADLPTSDPAAHYRSLHEVLLKLPGETIVFPSHDRQNLLFTTIETERGTNPDIKLSQEEFVRLKLKSRPSALNEDARKIIDFNRERDPQSAPPQAWKKAPPPGGADGAQGPAIPAIKVEKYREKLDAHDPTQAFIDVREPDEFSDKHMPGTTLIPLSELPLHLEELMRAKRVYLSCQSGRRSALAARSLSYVGFSDAVNVTGGILAWVNAGYPVEKA